MNPPSPSDAEPAAAQRFSLSVRVAFWMMVGAVGFAVLVVLIRRMSAEMDVFVIAFWRNVFATLMFAPWLLRVGTAGLRTRRLGLFTGRACIMTASSLCLFFGVVLMPIAEATALTFTSPLFSTILAVLLLKETAGPRRWAALVVGFLGVLVMLRPGVAALDPAAILPLLSALLFAGVVVTGKTLAATESPERIVAYLSLLSIPVSLVPALFVWEWPTASQLLVLVGIGIFANMNMYGISRALEIGDASMAMPFDFIRLPATALTAYVMFGERPDVWTWIGAAVIVSASVYIGHREAQARRRAG